MNIFVERANPMEGENNQDNQARKQVVISMNYQEWQVDSKHSSDSLALVYQSSAFKFLCISYKQGK